MKKYNRNMDEFEFRNLVRNMGLYFPLRKCLASDFREQVFTKLENGESTYDIQCWYDYKYHGFVHPDHKASSYTSKKDNH